MARVRWLGHACFEIQLGQTVILVDPWLEGNPQAPLKPSDLSKVDLVCVTHDHGDHLGDAFEICKRTGASFLATYELGVQAEQQGVSNVLGINIGGTVKVKDVEVTMVHAFHTAGRGAPTGFILKGEGKTVYHAGDTGLFGDMKLIGDLYQPYLALIPIGGYYTMGPREAVEAVKLLKPKVVIPMHYGSLPVLEPSAEKFVDLASREKLPAEIVVLKPGESYSF
ncbi:MAG: metal-dependent hydrolase [Candidatus Hecatellales archaeon]|nr:MAG: metal-dependent hydrolase [Candidatus Hecatellales archaeon]